MQENQNNLSINAFQNTQNISCVQAWDKLSKNKNSFLVDVRTKIELERDGYPDLSSIEKDIINIPLNLELDQPLVEFKKNLLLIFDKNDTIIFLCRSGKRSHYCTEYCLNEYVFSYNVLGGFCGGDEFDWINSGLSWSINIQNK